MDLNKVDLMIRDLLLRYPTLYANRFDAFAEIMTNSCYDWNERGELVCVVRQDNGPATVETMLARFQKKVAEAEAEYHDPVKTPECLRDLHLKFLTDARRDLHDAEFVAANLDTYAATWCGTDYKQVWHWLFYHHRHGIDHGYGAINNKPEVVDEEWRQAIRSWLRELMPPMHSIMGWHEDGKGWTALPEYAKVFNWVYATMEAYTTDEDRERAKKQDEIADEIISEILAEEKAQAG